MQLNEYHKAIINLAATGSAAVFDNKGVDHAALVMSTIFDNSKSHVRIYANNMKGDISNKDAYRNSVLKFLESGKKLQIILDDATHINISEGGAMNTLSMLLKNFRQYSNFQVHIASEDFKKELTSKAKDKRLYHFAIGDSKMFRLELDASTHEAMCSFNSPKTAEVLEGVFENHFYSCNPAIQASTN